MSVQWNSGIAYRPVTAMCHLVFLFPRGVVYYNNPVPTPFLYTDMDNNR